VPSLYLVNPDCSCPQYYGADVVHEHTGTRVAAIADLGITTVAALARPHFTVRLADEGIAPADLSLRPDWVGLTGKVSQVPRMIELARHYRAHGCKVAMGGPFASMSPEVLRPHCDVLIQGEMEEIAPEVFHAMAGGRPQANYLGTRPGLELSPLPAWDLYPNSHGLVGAVQTSRGCPFECEFCDVIQYLGRKQRFKPVDQVLAEVEQLYNFGYRRVLLCDDNFTVNRGRAKELVSALSDWNANRSLGRMSFMTQGSIDVARDDELLRLCAQAGLNQIFVGVETPHQASLKETKKVQNVGLDLHERMNRIVEHGITLEAGCVVGFDSDPADIFSIQREFWMNSCVPNVKVSNLVALESTPLYARIKRDGRLLDSSVVASSPWTANILPLRESRDQFEDKVRDLCADLYHPEAFGQRLEQFASRVGQSYLPEFARPSQGPISTALKAWMRTFSKLRGLEPELWRRTEDLVVRYPRSSTSLAMQLVQFMQQRAILRDNPPVLAV
jgi:radical SAM superfamily enzyme YgiQ (UPF0313 family)